MSVKFLNVTAEDAVEKLNEFVVEGYEIKVGLDAEYRETKKAKGGINNSSIEELIAKWSTKGDDWFMRVLSSLDQIYASRRHMYELREAHQAGLSLLSSDDSEKWSTLSRSLGAKIDKLNQFDDFIKREFRVEIEYTAGDKIANYGTGTQEINTTK